MPATVNHSGLLEGGFCIATRVRGGAVTPLHRALSITQLFCVHSFVRPTSSELYALKHNDITVEKDPKRLLVTVRNGKTGYRVANTMSGAVSAFERIKARHPDAGGEDYLFLPEYTNRATASRIFQRQFIQLMDETGLKHDPVTNTERSVYCLRHTAICMRIILSHGKVNIFNLAKNAGTSVEQIERFYAKHLPLSRDGKEPAELWRGLKEMVPNSRWSESRSALTLQATLLHRGRSASGQEQTITQTGSTKTLGSFGGVWSSHFGTGKLCSRRNCELNIFD
jgi:hypothetical protein